MTYKSSNVSIIGNSDKGEIKTLKEIMVHYFSKFDEKCPTDQEAELQERYLLRRSCQVTSQSTY